MQDADTNTDRPIKRTKSTGTGDATSDPDDVRTESFFSDDSEIEPIVKQRGIQHSTQ